MSNRRKKNIQSIVVKARPQTLPDTGSQSSENSSLYQGARNYAKAIVDTYGKPTWKMEYDEYQEYLHDKEKQAEFRRAVARERKEGYLFS